MPDTLEVPRVGETIPDIPLVASDGSVSRLHADVAGDRAVLFFMRAADCAVCLGHARALARLADAGELAGARVLVIAPGGERDAATAQARIGSDHLAVRASGDHHADLGLGRFLMLQHSGTFVIDADARVLSAVTSPLPTASFSKAQVLAALA